MARALMHDIDVIPLVGGRICLDLVNTTGARSSASPRERLNSYRDLLVWCRRVGLLSARQQRTLAAESAGRAKATASVLARVLNVRETLYRLMRSTAERRPPDAADVASLNRLWQQDRRRRSLVPAGPALAVRLDAEPDALDAMIWPVVESAVDLLTSGAVARLKRCGECDWLFVDDTKNQSRTWCKKECGDRVRARRHYGRVRRQRRSPKRSAP